MEKNGRERGKGKTWVQRPDMTSVGKVTIGHLHRWWRRTGEGGRGGVRESR